VNAILSNWNAMETSSAASALLHCCAAQRWANGVTALRPYTTAEDLFAAADRVWATMQEADWMEAFGAHPRIGERKAPHASAQSKEWSSKEQASVDAAQSQTLSELAASNARYEEFFGFTYVVCATGKTAEEMLEILQQRLKNDRQTELREAAEQQRQITQIRLRKWLEI